MRTHVKKKKYAEHVKINASSGMVNDAGTGAWVSGPGRAERGAYQMAWSGAAGKKMGS